MRRSRRNRPDEPSNGTWRAGRGALVATVTGLVIVGIGGLIFADWYTVLPLDTHATYVGRQSCVACHQAEAKLYAGSHHDRAMDRATPETVQGDFSGVELEHDGIRSRMFKQGERFMVRTEGPDGALADFEVKYVLGVEPLQNYMVEFDRTPDMAADELARLQVLRISWDTRAKQWFYLAPPDVFDKLAPDDELHWCGIGQRWNTTCAECHSTNVQKEYNDQTLRYRTTFSEIDVSCEACHGPGSTHVKLAKSKSLFWDRELGYGLTAHLKGDTNEAQVQVCAECHARRQVLADDYDPGDNYWDHYSTELLTRLTYQADGQVEDEDFEHGSFLQSKMYHKNVRCTDCHDPHSAKLKHEGNALCTSCHQHSAGRYDTPLHHHHKEGTAGASCVECHMPVTNYMEVHGRRDHSLRVPRPDVSVELGTSNACTGCHLDQKKLREAVTAAKSDLKPERLKQYLHFIQAARGGDETVVKELARLDQWSADAIERWTGKKPQKPDEPPPYAFALDAARRNDPNAEKLLAEVVKQRKYPAMVRATALDEWGQLGGNAALEASKNQLDDRHPLVRAAAVTNLAALPPKECAALLAPLLSDPDFAVRRVAARALVTAADELSGDDRSRLEIVLNEWIQGLLANNDRAAAHVMIGNLQVQRRQFAPAVNAYRQAIRVEPTALGARGQLADLMEALAADGVVEPHEHPQLRTEVLKLRAEELALLKRDVDRAPELAIVHYRYGQELLSQGEITGAVTALARAVELEPTVTEYGLTYAQALYANEQTAEAIEQLGRILTRSPKNTDAQRLLESYRGTE
jgi:tetratricopeptide (TPR) repeat protein